MQKILFDGGRGLKYFKWSETLNNNKILNDYLNNFDNNKILTIPPNLLELNSNYKFKLVF